MIKRILIVLAVVLVIGTLAITTLGWWMYRKFTGPMYEPGQLAALGSIQLPVQATDEGQGHWTVEPEIKLHHFARGAGLFRRRRRVRRSFPLTRRWPPHRHYE